MSLESLFNSVAWQRAVPKQHSWQQGPILMVVQVMALEDLTKLLRLLLTLGGSPGRERRFLRPRPSAMLTGMIRRRRWATPRQFLSPVWDGNSPLALHGGRGATLDEFFLKPWMIISTANQKMKKVLQLIDGSMMAMVFHAFSSFLALIQIIV